MGRTMWYGGVRITADRGGGGDLVGLLVGLAALAVTLLAIAAVITAVSDAAATAAGVARPWLAPTAVGAVVALAGWMVGRRALEAHRLRVFRAYGRAVVLERAGRAATRNLEAGELTELPAAPPVRADAVRLDEHQTEQAGVVR